jgi:hypothetical protein
MAMSIIDHVIPHSPRPDQPHLGSNTSVDAVLVKYQDLPMGVECQTQNLPETGFVASDRSLG